MLTENTVIEKSNRKFDISTLADDNESEKITLLNQLSSMPSFTNCKGYTCEAKVL